MQEEEMRTRGTPVTLVSFKAWKVKFDGETGVKKAKEEEEKLKALTPKEREEWRRIGTRLSGEFRVPLTLWNDHDHTNRTSS